MTMSCALAAFSSCKKEVSAELNADFEYSVAQAKVGDEITFKDLSSGVISRWSWVFEGAEKETSELSSPVVRWLDAGTYSVSLKVSNGNMSDEIKKEKIIKIDYYDQVTADFSFDKTMLFDNEYITFTNTSIGFPNTVKWTFTSDDGKVVESEEQNPKLVFSPGVYSIKLEISSPVASDVKEQSDAFTVLDRYAVLSSFSAMNRTTFDGGSVFFKNTSTGNVEGLEWTFEGGTPSTSTDENPVIKYDKPGSYKVILRTYNEKYEDTCTKEAFVKVVPSYGGMVFLLPFDGDSKDYGPYGLHPLSYTKGDLQPSYETGHGDGLGKAMKFPGGTKGKAYSVLQLPDKELLEVYPQGSEMTVSVWTKINGVSANNAIFAQGSCPGVMETGSNQIWGRFQSGHAFRVTAETTGFTGNTVTAKDNRFDDGGWHHLAVVYARRDVGGSYVRDLTIYLDGQVVGTPAKDKSDKNTDTVPYFIGSNLRFTSGAWAPENMFEGLMDDYILYNKALTQSEIAELASM